MIRKDILIKNSIYFLEGYSLAEDTTFLYMLFPKLNSIKYVKGAFYCYRCPEKLDLNIRYKYEKSVDEMLELLTKIHDVWKRENYYYGNEYVYYKKLILNNTHILNVYSIKKAIKGYKFFRQVAVDLNINKK